VKLGGSVITDKNRPFTARSATIQRLAKELHRGKAKAGLTVIVGHGGGSFPHTAAQRYGIHRGILGTKSYRGISLVQDAAARLNRMVVKALIEAGENAISVQPSATTLSEDSRIVHWDLRVLERMLDSELMPVVYGDVGLDLAQGCCILSTEEIFRYIAIGMPVSKIFIGSNVSGVYNKDPNVFTDAQHIRTITPRNFERILPSLGKSTGIDVTGGMRSKVSSLVEIVKERHKIHCELIGIRKPKVLENALRGKEVHGTIVRAG
jgi:isopentenyl phosphate kinase